jgi:hypothetical protein
LAAKVDAIKRLTDEVAAALFEDDTEEGKPEERGHFDDKDVQSDLDDDNEAEGKAHDF